MLSISSAEWFTPNIWCWPFASACSTAFNKRVGPCATANIQKEGLADRCEFHPLNFFLDPLPSADLYFMGSVLHEILLDDPGNEFHLWSLQLEFFLRGDQTCMLRTTDEYHQWLNDAGFRTVDVKFGTCKSFIFAVKD